MPRLMKENQGVDPSSASLLTPFFFFSSSVSAHHVRNKLHPCDSERNQSKAMDAFYKYTS